MNGVKGESENGISGVFLVCGFSGGATPLQSEQGIDMLDTAAALPQRV